MIDVDKLVVVGTTIVELGLLRRDEWRAVERFVVEDGPLSDALRAADSIHVHGRVDDVAAMPHTSLRGAGGEVENDRAGYIKYGFGGGVNAIFSSLDVAEDDRLADKKPRPHLDHLGIDLRRTSPTTQAIFDDVPTRARSLGWRHVAQGNPDQPVFCCHTSVALKHWVFPNRGDVFERPIELAYGPLEIHAGSMGCDLRPIDPAHPGAKVAGCCAASGAK